MISISIGIKIYSIKQQIKIDGEKIVCGCPRTDFSKKINFGNNKCITFALPPTKNELKMRVN